MYFKDKLFEAYNEFTLSKYKNLVLIDPSLKNLLEILKQEQKSYNQTKKLKEAIEKDYPNRYTMLPITEKVTWENYKKAEASFWIAEEIDLEEDKKHWKKLTSDEKDFIKHVLAFFAASDGIVLENLAERFMSEIPIPEVRAFYGYQIAQENIHSETYSLLIDTFIEDEDEKYKLFNAIENYQVIKKKANWAIKWIQSNDNIMVRLLGFIFVEGVFFSPSFASLFWLKKKGKMPGLTFSNQLIARDEAGHVEEPIHLYLNILSKYLKRVPYKKVAEMTKECVEIEQEFVRESLKCDLIGMNSKMMCQYVEFVADKILSLLEYKKLYNVKNPFPWMDFINIEGVTNQFEQRVSEYRKSNEKNVFRTDLIV